MITSIYGLVNPENNQIFYVGKTTMKLSLRLQHHLSDARKQSTSGRGQKKTEFMQSLLSQSIKPSIILLEEVGLKLNPVDREHHWISFYHSISPLTNRMKGETESMRSKVFYNEKCKQCAAEITVKVGARPRQFCDNNQKCRNEWFRKNKKEKEKKVVVVPCKDGTWMMDGKKVKLELVDEIGQLQPQESAKPGKQDNLPKKEKETPVAPESGLSEQDLADLAKRGGSPDNNKKDHAGTPIVAVDKAIFDAGKLENIKYDESPQYVEPHPLYKIGDPKENTGAFFLKYNCMTYEQLAELKK